MYRADACKNDLEDNDVQCKDKPRIVSLYCDYKMMAAQIHGMGRFQKATRTVYHLFVLLHALLPKACRGNVFIFVRQRAAA
jgi:hypothetical protein